MRFLQILSRLALVSLAAGIFAILMSIYAASGQSLLPNSHDRTARQDRASWPDVSESPTLIGEVAVLVLFAMIGRIVFRLRLSPAPRNEGQLLRLKLE